MDYSCHPLIEIGTNESLNTRQRRFIQRIPLQPLYNPLQSVVKVCSHEDSSFCKKFTHSIHSMLKCSKNLILKHCFLFFQFIVTKMSKLTNTNLPNKRMYNVHIIVMNMLCSLTCTRPNHISPPCKQIS